MTKQAPGVLSSRSGVKFVSGWQQEIEAMAHRIKKLSVALIWF
jgi:hypothetical protein